MEAALHYSIHFTPDDLAEVSSIAGEIQHDSFLASQQLLGEFSAFMDDESNGDDETDDREDADNDEDEAHFRRKDGRAFA